MRVVFAKEDVWATNPATGLPVQLTQNEPWDSDDPFVKARRDLFATQPVKIRRTVEQAPVERATRAPGERRVVKHEDS